LPSITPIRTGATNTFLLSTEPGPNEKSNTNQTNQTMNDQDKAAADIFGPVLYTYSRSQAVADGFQIEVSKVAQEAGIRFRVFLTRAVYVTFVSVPPDVAGQDEAGRLWDIIPSR
jgi:hypothetical protein